MERIAVIPMDYSLAEPIRVHVIWAGHQLHLVHEMIVSASYFQGTPHSDYSEPSFLPKSLYSLPLLNRSVLTSHKSAKGTSMLISSHFGSFQARGVFSP